jgi:hypothetical protein
VSGRWKSNGFGDQWNWQSLEYAAGIRHEFLPQGANPITMVRQSAKRMRTPDILEVSELITEQTHSADPLLTAEDRRL